MRIKEWKNDYCADIRDYYELDGKPIWSGIDFRSEPEDSENDRVCCMCGESLSADGKCDCCKDQNIG